MKEFNNKEKIAIVYFLSAIMEADSIIDDREQTYLNKIVKHLNIGFEVFDHLDAYSFEQCRTIIASMPAPNRDIAKNFFYEMAMADGYFDYREKRLIDQILL